MPLKWRHPASETMRTYGTWANMKYRCHNPEHPQFADYGGRGITVCARWREDYDAFYDDMGPRPQGKTIDRIDNNQGYSPLNCRWATKAQQCRNTRRNPDIVFKDFAAEKGIHYSTLMHRKRVGAKLDAPVREYRRGNDHGTLSRYVRFKCRCEECKKGFSDYQKARRKTKVYDL